jgi:hypothetical protein
MLIVRSVRGKTGEIRVGAASTGLASADLRLSAVQ